MAASGSSCAVTDMFGPQHMARRRVHLLGRDRGDAGGPCLDVAHLLAGGQGSAEHTRRATQRIAGVDRLGQQAAAGAGQLRIGDAVGKQALQLPVHRTFEVGHVRPRARARVDAEGGAVEPGAAVEAAGAGGQTLLDHDAAEQAAGAAPAQDLGQQLQGVAMLVARRGVARGQEGADQARLADALVAQANAPLGMLRRLGQPCAGGHGAGDELAIGPLGQRP